MKHDDDAGTVENDGGRNRRTVLRTVGIVGTLGAYGVGTASARGNGNGPPDRGSNGNDDRGPGGPPEKCDCDDAEFIAKYDFDDETCEFVLAEGEDVVELSVSAVKDGDDCEPIAVDYESTKYVLREICAFGGRDTDSADDVDPESGTFESDLENPGGQRAAISNVTFCGTTCIQIDLVGGEPIEQFPDEDSGYSDEGRLLDFLFACADDEEISSGNLGSGTAVKEVDGETCELSWDTFEFDPNGSTASVDEVGLTDREDNPEECVASVVAYRLPPGAEDDPNPLPEQEFLDALTVTLSKGEPEALTLDLDLRI